MKQICIFLLFISPGLLHSQIQLLNKTASNATYIRGSVYDKASGEAVISAIIYLAGTPYGVESDINGYFSLKCIPGTFTLRVQCFGYFSDSLKIQIDSSSIITLRCSLRNVIADTATINPAAGIIYGLSFSKKGKLDTLDSRLSSLDSLAEMMLEKPEKKIIISVGYHYDDGSFTSLDEAAAFIRRYLIAKGVSGDRFEFSTSYSASDHGITRIRIERIPDITKQKRHIFHHKAYEKKTRKRNGVLEVQWDDHSQKNEVKVLQLDLH